MDRRNGWGQRKYLIMVVWKYWNLEEISREECEDEGRCDIYFTRRILCRECGCWVIWVWKQPAGKTVTGGCSCLEERQWSTRGIWDQTSAIPDPLHALVFIPFSVAFCQHELNAVWWCVGTHRAFERHLLKISRRFKEMFAHCNIVSFFFFYKQAKQLARSQFPECYSLSRARLFATPQAVACQAPLSMILQARMLEWVAISFSRKPSNLVPQQWKHKVLTPGLQFAVDYFSLCNSFKFTGKQSRKYREFFYIHFFCTRFAVFSLSLFFFLCGPFLKSLLNLLCYCFCFFLLFICLFVESQLPDKGLNPHPLALEGKSPNFRWPCDLTLTFHFHALEKGMATHSSVLAWRIPGTEEPGGLPSVGSHRVGRDWSDLAAATTAAAQYVCCFWWTNIDTFGSV